MLIHTPRRLTASLLAAALLAWTSATAYAQPAAGARRTPMVVHEVTEANERIEMSVNTSRILTLAKPIEQVQVNNPEILQPTALSPNEVQISAKSPGVTEVNLWTEDDQIYSIDVIAYPDARVLNRILKAQFPNSALRVMPLNGGVLISGHVNRAEDVGTIVRIAEEFSPKVINNMTVIGVQQVLLHVKVMEVSRTKLRSLGFDFAEIANGVTAISTVSGLITGASNAAVGTTGGETFKFSIFDSASSFSGVLEALRQDNLMKILAEPALVGISGRAASFNSGGEFPIMVPQSLGTVSIEFKKFGTQVEFVPIVLGDGRIRLEVRPRVTEIDSALSVTLNDTTVPALRTREVDTAVEMQAGQTLAIAGLVQSRTESENKGLPWISEVPYVGAAFRRVQEKVNEVELLITVTPELVEPMNACEVPMCGPGQRTVSPSDCELFWHGHLEVPNCASALRGGAMGVAPGCGVDGGMQSSGPMIPGMGQCVGGPQTRQTRPNPQGRYGNSAQGSRNIDAGFVGPIGYDVIK